MRETLGTLIIKEQYHLSDEATIEHIVMNLYLQYFIVIEEYIAESPFDASMLKRFRKRITPEMLQRVNDISKVFLLFYTKIDKKKRIVKV